MYKRLGFLALVLVVVLAVGVSISSASSPTSPSSGLTVQITSAISADTVTYSITLVNDTSMDIGNIYLAGLVPTGTSFVKATATPPGSWFRGFEVESAVWLSDKVPAKGKQGPFSYQVKIIGPIGSAHAWVHWAAPSEGTAVSAATKATKYVGSEACAKCHAKKYNNFRVAGHGYKLRTAADAMKAPLPLPEGYTWDDISYVIGGYKWKARYMDKQGYIITTAAGKPGKNQYNMMTGTWVDYHPGEMKKYDCGRCHTTGYSSEGHQDGLPGIVGTWAFPGVQCEACHGPGGDHIAGKAKMVVDESAALCGKCHIRGKATEIPASGGFIRHHEQYNEFLASPHRALSCVACHSPHKKAEFSIEAACSTCHSGANAAFTGSQMQKVGVTCTDCHMPKASKSAVKFGPYEGDVMTHLFEINIDPKAKMFTDDGNLAKGYLTLDFACLQCHKDKDVQWAANYAQGIHSLGKK
ncbi:MAG: cytochrome c3 family protein [Chloroflexi bacterium]|nr:cytochrome c3 family protein [Chloroflexota bacterium]MCL5074053.1 cytochrome c3 family protein [Chloroflexota bacterium]